MIYEEKKNIYTISRLNKLIIKPSPYNILEGNFNTEEV